MINITEYSDDELSLHVFNDEYLYNNRHKMWFMDIINEFYEYTPEQLEVLLDDLADDMEEES